MGFYTERVLPRITDRACASDQVRPLRRRVCAGTRGRVVEIGFGSGLNLPYYPEAVTQVDAVEPSDVAWSLAERRRGAATVPVRRSGRDAQSLPYADDTFDAAVSTWVLCSVPRVDLALQELRRVLEPGGRLHFVEHGLAPDESVRRWQRRLEPIQKRIAGGCHLTRSVVDLLVAAGFEVGEVDAFYEEGTPKVLGADVLGVAVSP
jgi:ubiquinone/menaquinone biosynthesis C-methylase UbiE